MSVGNVAASMRHFSGIGFWNDTKSEITIISEFIREQKGVHRVHELDNEAVCQRKKGRAECMFEAERRADAGGRKKGKKH